ncbi:hypothetical protein LEMLEM_LOCUS7383, partial [Lemmus lemmus]
HTGEDSANELTDHVLVAAHTQRLSQKEGHSDSATEARQVMLRPAEAQPPPAVSLPSSPLSPAPVSGSWSRPELSSLRH